MVGVGLVACDGILFRCYVFLHVYPQASVFFGLYSGSLEIDAC